MEENTVSTPLFTNDAVVLGILLLILAFVFETSSRESGFWSKFYRYVPSLLLCYFIPSLLNTLGIISGSQSALYPMASQYLLPASLVLLTLSIDFKAIIQLGPKALIMFLSGTVGVMIGGPLAIMIMSLISPETVDGTGPDAVWRGMATIAGSWIGGGANQAAMKEVFQPSGNLFSIVIAVDVIVANIWMAVLLYGAGIADKLDAKMKADTTAIEALKIKIENYRESIARMPALKDWITLAAIGFGATGFAHAIADVVVPWIKANAPGLSRFSLDSRLFWIVVIATTIGLLLSFTKARNMEGVGASRMGSLFLYVLVATIGMEMNIMAIFANPGLFVVGAIWMLIHVSLMLVVARIIRAPFFFTAVGSQANIGGAASAPIVASVFHPSLASVGVLLAVLGYALGTYGGYISSLLMSRVAP
jgi:uncharacterized membrane protein